MIANIQIPLPPYKPVQPEDFPRYQYEQRYKWYISLINIKETHPNTTSLIYYRHVRAYQPRVDKSISSFKFVLGLLGPLPHER